MGSIIEATLQHTHTCLKMRRVADAPGNVPTSASVLAAGMDAMVTMLPGPSAVEEVYCGAGGALAAAGGIRPRLLLDCSTIDPPTARRVAEAAEAAPLHPEVCESTHHCISFRKANRASVTSCGYLPYVYGLRHFCHGQGRRNADAQNAVMTSHARWQVTPVAGWERRSPVMVDAPVSGGVVGAQAATLTFMVRRQLWIPLSMCSCNEYLS